MNILYVGDIMGEVGVEAVERALPGLINEKQIDLVIAQAENVTEGRGISVDDFRRLQKAGIDFCTGGNWTAYRQEIFSLLKDPNEPIIEPANMPDRAGSGWKYIEKNGQKVLIVSLLGHIVGKDSEKLVENPLLTIDKILETEKITHHDVVIVNFHGDFSSEKVIIGHYLDGRITAVIGDHWHVPTADARVLPKGTAHITDVGMCGAWNASLGISFDSVIPRWRDGQPTRNVLETAGLRQFNAVLVKANNQSLADSIEQIQKTI